MSVIKKLTKVIQNTEYQPYDPNLPHVFNKIKGIIQQEIPDLIIEHVGSSSVPGTGGRNAIDIAIPANEKEHNAIKSKLYEIGFNDSPWPHYIPIQVGMIDSQNKEYPILLYVISPDSNIFNSWIMYRDYMRTHPEDAQKYDQVKQDVVGAAGSVRSDEYQNGKTPFILSMMEKIRKIQK